MSDYYWVAYPEGVEKVQFIERGAGGRRGVRGVITKPVIVQNDDGDEYVIGEGDLHVNPVLASIAVAELQQKYGVANALRENPVGGPEIVGDEEEEEGEENDDDAPYDGDGEESDALEDEEDPED